MSLPIRRTGASGLMLAILSTVLAVAVPSVAVAAQGDTTRVSVDSNGTEGNDGSFSKAVSSDGRYVAFESMASNLVGDDTNGVADVFVQDRNTGETIRVSVSTGGDQGNDHSFSPAISADGRHIAFVSLASNMVPGDSNDERDVFVHDLETGETTRVSVSTGGDEGNKLSFSPAISADGRHIAFVSSASNLVDDDSNGVTDVFLHDRETKETSRVSVHTDGTEGNNSSVNPTISADGGNIAFDSSASNLVDDDTNVFFDVFVHDRVTAKTTRVSVRSDGNQANNGASFSAISADGLHVTFHSAATTLVDDDTNNMPDVFVHDRDTGNTNRVSLHTDRTEGDGPSESAAISGDGRYVSFASEASNLVDGDTNGARDVFVQDRVSGATTRVSQAGDGTEANNDSESPVISTDGRYVAFVSVASNLVGGDTNGVSDVFVHQFLPDPPPPPPPPPPPDPSDVDWFVDDDGTTFEGDINAIATAGITRGCNPPVNDRFCPDDEVTRGQMAAFLVRALGLPAPALNPFVDTEGNTFQRDIQALAAAGITRGCNPPANDRFCPDDKVTRGQMAAFLTRALDLTAPADNPFVDTTGNTFQRDIQALAAAEITKGCNPPANDRFCPDDHVTRGQMAAFLNRGLLK